MKEIFLTQGQVAFVDDADYKELSKYKWQALKENLLFLILINFILDFAF